MEIITGVERPRRRRNEDKLRIVAEAPGAVFAEVARRHEVSRGQLWSWRRLARAGALRGALMPAASTGGIPKTVQSSPRGLRRMDTVELTLTMKTMGYLGADSDRCCYDLEIFSIDDLEIFSIDAGLVEIEMLRGRGLGLYPLLMIRF